MASPYQSSAYFFQISVLIIPSNVNRYSPFSNFSGISLDKISSSFNFFCNSAISHRLSVIFFLDSRIAAASFFRASTFEVFGVVGAGAGASVAAGADSAGALAASVGFATAGPAGCSTGAFGPVGGVAIGSALIPPIATGATGGASDF